MTAPSHGMAHVMGKLQRDDGEEGARVPEGLRVFDAHVHLFPERLFQAIWRWFDAHAWPVRYRLTAEQGIAFLRARGVTRMTALVYAHKPGMAESLNDFVAALGRAHPEVIPLGTVLPGEPGAGRIVRHALEALGLRGLKLHCHVQRLAPDDPRLDEVYAAAQDAQKPVLIHAGREPSTPAYGIDTRAITSAGQVERVLQRFPRLKLVVPHLGADEIPAYLALLGRYENLWLDTTMVLSGALPGAVPQGTLQRHADRLLFGTDFPNIPYAWDTELRAVLRAGLSPRAQQQLLWDNAAALYGT